MWERNSLCIPPPTHCIVSHSPLKFFFRLLSFHWDFSPVCEFFATSSLQPVSYLPTLLDSKFFLHHIDNGAFPPRHNSCRRPGTYPRPVLCPWEHSNGGSNISLLCMSCCPRTTRCCRLQRDSSQLQYNKFTKPR